MRLRISCINKDPRDDPYRAIKYVGGVRADGSPWRLPLKEAVEGSLDGAWDFYVKQGDHTVEVEPAKSRWGNWYLKTEGDEDTPDNLLNLEECPS